MGLEVGLVLGLGLGLHGGRGDLHDPAGFVLFAAAVGVDAGVDEEREV